MITTEQSSFNIAAVLADHANKYAALFGVTGRI
jgi:hypothetical protein